MRNFTAHEKGILHAGLTELLRNPQLVAQPHFRITIYVLATTAFVGPTQRGESVPRTVMELANEFAPEVPEQWVSLAEAAPVAGKTVHTLRRWCREGYLPEYAYRKIGRNWQVELGEFERFLEGE